MFNITLPDERQQIILQRLAEDGRVLAAELARDFGTSEDTIRRDLRELAGTGQCRRVYGGALPVSVASTTLQERVARAPARKAALARAAVSLVRAGDVLLIDAGSTNEAIARALPERQGITVITNAPSIATTLAGRDGVDVLLLGGRLDHRSGGTKGARVVDEIRRVRANLCFVGTCGISSGEGISASDRDEAEVKEAMVLSSESTAAVVTADKLETRATFLAASVTSLTHLVVEANTLDSLLNLYRAAGVNVHSAEEAIDD